jgi:MFS family permease
MTSLMIAMILFVNSGISLIIMLLVLGSVLFSIMPIISAYAMDTAGKMNEGSSIAFLFTGGSIAGAIAPVIAGIFFDKWGFDGLIIFTASLSLLGLFIVIGYTFYNIRNKK